MNSLSILGIGLLLGLRHATDADHVVAITTIVSKQQKIHHATWVGVIWGIGHTLMIVIIGILIIIFHVSIPETLQKIFELIVSVVLIVLGLKNLFIVPPAHTHIHLDMPLFVRPFVVGLIHGLAGSAAIALLILSSIHDEKIALLYLGIFGTGTIIGMMTITTLIGLPFIFSQSKFQRLDRVFSLLAGGFSILYGLYYGYTILF